ncbi:hypothetical protein Q7P37_003807 [Cladosporium fusiforme]
MPNANLASTMHLSPESTFRNGQLRASQRPLHPSSMTEVFSAIGFPARVLGRIPLLTRYASTAGRKPSSYGLQRYGSSYKYRLWLRLDAAELESIELLINNGSDHDIDAFRDSHIATSGTTSVVGGLLVSGSSAILALESLSEIHYAARALFILSLLLSLLSVYFTLLEQRELLAMDSRTLRLWLWDGSTGNDPKDSNRQIWRSSLSSNIMLQAPFELLAISIALFLAALGFYLGLAYASRVTLSKGWDSNLATLIAFVVTAVFSLSVFGQALGQKDKELAKCKALVENEAVPVHGGPSVLHSETSAGCGPQKYGTQV